MFRRRIDEFDPLFCLSFFFCSAIMLLLEVSVCTEEGIHSVCRTDAAKERQCTA